MQDRKIENSSKSDVCTICSGADCRTGGLLYCDFEPGEWIRKIRCDVGAKR